MPDGGDTRTVLHVRKPTTQVTPAQVADRDRWRELTAESLSSARTSAEKWQAGLAGLISLVTAGLFIKGPTAAQDLTTWWRLGLTVLLGGGLLLAVLGLRSALDAAAGTSVRFSYDQMRKEYGTVRQFEVASARRAVDTLARARRLVGYALGLFIVALVVWWWAPPAPASPPARLAVETSDGTVCGTLETADQAEFRIQVNGTSVPRVIPFADVSNARIVAAC